MFKNIGWPEVLVVGVVIVILFGGKLLPKLGKNIGESGKQMKEATKELKDVITDKQRFPPQGNFAIIKV